MSSAPHDITVPGTPQVREVSEDIYAYIQPDGTWWINNTGFLVGGGGVISVDACSTERRTRAYLDAIAAVTDQPVRTLINTHHHGDHTYGNYLFPRRHDRRPRGLPDGDPGLRAARDRRRSGPRSTGAT